jgi:zinc transport system substrate-binding protein
MRKAFAMRYTISLSVATLLLSTAAMAEVPRVVTDIPPVHSLVAMVMGDLGAPDLLVDKGADPHSFQLRPSQAANLAEADLIIWVGHEMTPWLERTLDGLETKAAQIELLDAPGTETRSYADDGAHDHDAVEAEPAAGEDAHGHEDRDPHAWLDPHNAKIWLDLIATKLSELDTDNAATYAANAAAGAAQITAIEGEISALLEPVKAKPFVVYHDAYGYFAAHFDLNVAGEIAIGDATSPSAAKLAELRAALAAGSATCIFPEANHDPKLLVQITDGTPTAIGGVLDPEGANLTPGPMLYPELMRALATTLADCLAKS